MNNPFDNNETGVTVYQNNAPANKFADMGFDISVDMTSAQLSFSSLRAETDEEKASLFNAINNPEKRLADCINMTIKAKDLYIEVVNCTDEETGEIDYDAYEEEISTMLHWYYEDCGCECEEITEAEYYEESGE